MPWKVNEDDEKADGECLIAIKLSEEEIAEQIREKEFDMGDTAAPRRLKITRADLKTHGYSARCDGCRAALEGRPAQNHSEECRRRMLEAIGKDDPRLDAQKQRFNQFVDKAVAKEDSDELQRDKKRVRFEDQAAPVTMQARGAKRASEGYGRADLGEAQIGDC